MTNFRTRLLPGLLICSLVILTAAAPEREPSTDQASPTDLQARKDLAKLISGKIVFDSNRGKGFGIHTMDLKTGDITPLADSDGHEMYPDVSPDGKWVAYSLAASLDKRAESSAWIVPSKGGEARKLADIAMFPTFSADGKSIYFERSRRKVMKFDLASNVESEIFPNAHPSFQKGDIVKPQVSPNGQFVAFISNRPRRWSSWLVDLQSGEATLIGPGCEPSWAGGNDRLIWISGNKARERSGVFAFDVKTKAVSTLQDADEPRGHEYFPTVTEDKKFLLYSAARPKEHKPTTANYQLFVKDLKTDKVVRLTFDPYTNRWPKILPAK